ncbi:SDR family oxidoreductase [Paraburkholderia sp.]|uniref:SDR family oxidoreductase n=1 Tax=Paraburkholderia sp. TaxID=1926495 RepID=UPI003D6F4C15
MRVFVTGATGFIGEAVVRELVAAGHTVLGLARSDAAAATLARTGVDVQRGDLTDTASLVAGALACDGVAHLAFIHDFSAYEAAAETDRRAVEAMTGALEGSGKSFVLTSATALAASGGVTMEDDTPPDGGLPRGRTEAVVLAAAGRGVRTSIVRLSVSVHGAGDHGFVPRLIDFARRTGVAAFIGDGGNRWPAVHRLDAARLYRLALEKAAPGSRLHGVAESGVPMRAIAETIGAGLGVPVRSLSVDEAAGHFGWMTRFVAMDNPTSSDITRTTCGWQPQEPDLLTDMRTNGYFG